MSKLNYPYVSIVIPTLNEARYLASCLASLRRQTHKNFEIVVSDGGSTDNTVELAKHLGAKVVITSNTNVSLARQKGIEIAKGEIIIGADADTKYPKNHVDRVISDFQKDREIVAVGGIAIFEKQPWWFYYYWKVFYLFASWLFRTFHLVIYTPALNLAFRRDVFINIGGYNTYLDFGGDELDILRRLKKVGKVYFDNHLFVYPSNRRAKVGFVSFLFKHFLRDYVLSYTLSRLLKKQVIKSVPIR